MDEWTAAEMAEAYGVSEEDFQRFREMASDLLHFLSPVGEDAPERNITGSEGTLAAMLDNWLIETAEMEE